MGGLFEHGLAAEVVALVVLCIAAAAVALVGAVRVGQQAERSEAELLLGPLAVLMAALAVSSLLWTGWDPAVPEVLQQRAVSHGASGFLLPMVALPAFAVACVATAFVAWRGPRAWSQAAWVVVPGGLAAAGILGGGLGQPDWVFSVLRAGAVGMATGMLALGSTRSDPRGEALRSVALGVLVAFVAALETSHGGLVTLLTVGQLDKLTPGTWAKGVATFDAIVWTSRAASWAVTAGLGLVALGSLRRAPRGVRAGVILCVALSLGLLGLSRPSAGLLDRLAVLCPEAPEVPEAPATSR